MGDITIKLSNRWLYTIITFVMIIVGLGVVYAYGTSDPQVLGHTLGEIDFADESIQIEGLSGRNFFIDTENRGRLRVGAAWNIPGIYSEDAQDLVIGVDSNHKILIGTKIGNNLNNFMTIKGDGKVGIGTASPSTKLDVVGTIKTQKLQLGNKWLLSGVGDSHGDDSWLRLFNSGGSNYYGGLAVNNLWVGGTITGLKNSVSLTGEISVTEASGLGGGGVNEIKNLGNHAFCFLTFISFQGDNKPQWQECKIWKENSGNWKIESSKQGTDGYTAVTCKARCVDFT